ncbi:MAG: hypothetical protein JW833_02470 [Prolixibacteraceae bacterium]|nr:hypothetical protein [Prolixibacteraceae bacterium]
MYFLNGSRNYINPENRNSPVEDQLRNCIENLNSFDSNKRIYKVNFFIDAESKEERARLKQKARELLEGLFGEEVILNIISQPPLTCKVIAEAFYYDPEDWKAEFIKRSNAEAVCFVKNNSKVLIGYSQSLVEESRQKQSEIAFQSLEEILEQNGFDLQNIVRQWNYIEDILAVNDGKQNYQEFNNTRSLYYSHSFDSTGYPAATGIGMNMGGILIEFVAVNSDATRSFAINNPSQIDAHKYSSDVLKEGECGKTTPKFERARYLEMMGNKLIFISGTAAILGEKTQGINKPAKQTKITIQNIQQLYSEPVLKKVNNGSEPHYGHARVYIKDRKDFAAIRRVFKMYYPDLPVVYIIADICRDDLLVEIEGEVILK